MDGLSLAELRKGLASGETDLQAWPHRVAYGRGCLAEALAEMRAPAFGDALQVLAG